MYTAVTKKGVFAVAIAACLSAPVSSVAADSQSKTAQAAAAPVIDQVMPFDEVSAMPSNLASQIIGATAYTLGGKAFGRVDDIILDNSGRMVGLRIGAGGAFGFDETELAVPMSDVTLKNADGTLNVATDLAEQDVRDAAAG